MGRAAVFIDGGYFDYVLRDLGLFGKIDYVALANQLADPKELLRAYYYHCLPWQSATPTEEESRRLGNMQRFLDTLDSRPRFMVRRGRLAPRGFRPDGSPIFQQKQVDILMATDIVLLSAKRQVEEIVLVTGDSDFLPAVRIARDEGVLVRLAHGHGRNQPHHELWNTVDERVELTEAWLATCRSPKLPPNP